jgi:hypothetical protein
MGDLKFTNLSSSVAGRHVKTLVSAAFANVSTHSIGRKVNVRQSRNSSRKVNVRQAADRKKRLPNLYHNMVQTYCADLT